ncbi:hypothetical protein [Nostoc sp. MG11]|nr:hypothetical protein [Nostoc sp. MG11]
MYTSRTPADIPVLRLSKRLAITQIFVTAQVWRTDIPPRNLFLG